MFKKSVYLNVVTVCKYENRTGQVQIRLQIVSRDVFFHFRRPTWNVDPNWCRLYSLFFLNIYEGLRRHDKTWHVKQCVTLFVTNSGNSEPCCPTEMIDFPGPPGDEGRDQDPLRGAKSGESVEHGGTTETVPGSGFGVSQKYGTAVSTVLVSWTPWL